MPGQPELRPHQPVYRAISPDLILGLESWVCRSSFTRSIGATMVLDTPPAVPPAARSAANLIALVWSPLTLALTSSLAAFRVSLAWSAVSFASSLAAGIRNDGCSLGSLHAVEESLSSRPEQGRSPQTVY